MIKKWFYCCALILLVQRAYAQEIPEDTAVRIIISEAADQGLIGMVCVGEVLRNRGGTRGFHGNGHIHGLPQSVWEMARRAWELSASTNYTKGADHFEDIHRFGRPWWLKHCVKTFEYKGHVFYKEIHSHG